MSTLKVNPALRTFSIVTELRFLRRAIIGTRCKFESWREISDIFLRFDRDIWQRTRRRPNPSSSTYPVYFDHPSFAFEIVLYLSIEIIGPSVFARTSWSLGCNKNAIATCRVKVKVIAEIRVTIEPCPRFRERNTRRKERDTKVRKICNFVLSNASAKLDRLFDYVDRAR